MRKFSCVMACCVCAAFIYSETIECPMKNEECDPQEHIELRGSMENNYDLALTVSRVAITDSTSSEASTISLKL